jgi:hypothetical protein
MSAGDERQQEMLAKQLAMNRQTWTALQQRGVTEDTALRLDFFYVAAGEQQANALAELIRRETDYEVQAGSRGGGLLKKQTWTVTGTTRETKVSQEILDQWVTWMIAAGTQTACEFDGWGALAPDSYR